MALVEHRLDGMLNHPLTATAFIHGVLSWCEEAVASKLANNVLSAEYQFLGEVSDATWVAGEDGVGDLAAEGTGEVVGDGRAGHHGGHTRIVGPRNKDEPSVIGNGGVLAN